MSAVQRNTHILHEKQHILQRHFVRHSNFIYRTFDLQWERILYAECNCVTFTVTVRTVGPTSY